MKEIYLDTNIILDFLGNRAPFGIHALRIFKKGLNGDWKLWTSSISVTTAYYILEKELDRNKAKEKIGLLLNYVSIHPITKQNLQTALASQFKDFEDGVQHFCALSNGSINCIVTRNQKDFQHSQIPVMGPEELFL